jgi:hypothetical protein
MAQSARSRKASIIYFCVVNLPVAESLRETLFGSQFSCQQQEQTRAAAPCSETLLKLLCSI